MCNFVFFVIDLQLCITMCIVGQVDTFNGLSRLLNLNAMNLGIFFIFRLAILAGDL